MASCTTSAIALADTRSAAVIIAATRRASRPRSFAVFMVPPMRAELGRRDVL